MFFHVCQISDSPVDSLQLFLGVVTSAPEQSSVYHGVIPINTSATMLLPVAHIHSWMSCSDHPTNPTALHPQASRLEG